MIVVTMFWPFVVLIGTMVWLIRKTLPVTSAVKNGSGLASEVVQDNVESGGVSNEGSLTTGGPEVTVQGAAGNDGLLGQVANTMEKYSLFK